MLVAWDDKYSVNNYLIDEQHKRLFELANVASNMIGKQTNPAEIKKILAALFEYMRTHFIDEEEYMRSIEYPRLEAHQEKHRHIVAQMMNLVKNMNFDFKQKLVIIMEQWLLKHILQDDMDYAHYVAQKNKERAARANKQTHITDPKHNEVLQRAVMEPRRGSASANAGGVSSVASGASAVSVASRTSMAPKATEDSKKIESTVARSAVSKTPALKTQESPKTLESKELESKPKIEPRKPESLVAKASGSKPSVTLASKNPESSKLSESKPLDSKMADSKKPKSKPKSHMYVCLCGKTYKIDPNIHAKIQNGEGIKCPECTTFIKYITDI